MVKFVPSSPLERLARRALTDWKADDVLRERLARALGSARVPWRPQRRMSGGMFLLAVDVEHFKEQLIETLTRRADVLAATALDQPKEVLSPGRIELRATLRPGRTGAALAGELSRSFDAPVSVEPDGEALHVVVNLGELTVRFLEHLRRHDSVKYAQLNHLATLS